MTTDVAARLKEYLASVPHCNNPAIYGVVGVAEVGFKAGRYAMAQEVLAMLEDAEGSRGHREVIDVLSAAISDDAFTAEIDLRSGAGDEAVATSHPVISG